VSSHRPEHKPLLPTRRGGSQTRDYAQLAETHDGAACLGAARGLHRIAVNSISAQHQPYPYMEIPAASLLRTS